MTVRSTRALAPLALVVLALAGCKKDGGSGPDVPQQPTCTLSPGAPLRVLEMNPPPGSQYVSVTATVSLRFNTCLDLSTVDAVHLGLFTGFGLTTPVAVVQSYDPRDATLSLDPSANLLPDETYLVTVSMTVKGAHGETQTMAYQQTFHTRATPDVTPPATTASPRGGRYNTAQQVTLSCSDGGDGGGCARTYFTVDGSTPTTASPVYAVPLPVTHDTTIRFFSVDFDGNAEAPRTETYVLDTVPPTIEAIDPHDGATGVPRTVRIRARFSEPMAVGSFNSTNVTMSPSPERTYGWELDGATDALVLTIIPEATSLPVEVPRPPVPRRRLDCGTRYTVTFGTGVRDVAGNGLVAPVTSSFTTSGDCDEPVTTASLPDGVYTAAPQAVTLTCTDAGGSGCARIVYTLDGTMPSFYDDPLTVTDERNGTVVSGATAGPISLGTGDTVLRFQAEDLAGNLEVVKEERYSISTTGFTWVVTGLGLARGIGPVPDAFVPVEGAGVVEAFFRDPTNGRLYRAAERGLYASDDGVSWSRTVLVGDQTHTQLRATAVYAQGSLVFVGTSGGLFRSEDGGATFQYLDEGRVSPPWIVAITGDGKDVFAAGNNGIRVSHDRGQTFVETEPDTWFTDLAIDPAKRLVFVASNLGVRVTAADGTSTRTLDTASGLPSNLVNALALTPSAVYVATDLGLAIFARDADGQPSGTPTVRTYADGLGTWGAVERVAVDAASGAIYAKAEYGDPPYLYRSTNGGASWTLLQLTQPTTTGKAYGGIYLDGSVLCIGATPGWYRSTDGGASFTEMDLPYISRVTHSNGTLYAASSGSTGEDGLLISTDGFRTFVGKGQRNGMGASGGRVDSLVVQGSSVYAGTSSGLAMSTDGGTTFALRTTANGLEAPNVDDLAVQPGKIWAATTNWLNLSLDGGATFTRFFSVPGSSAALAADGSNVYWAHSSGVQVSSDGGTTFSAAAGTFNQPQDVTVAPSGTVYLATGSGVLASTDHGASFTALPALGAGWVDSVDATASALYVGRSYQLGISTDGGQTFTWRDASKGIAGTPKDTCYQPPPAP